MFHWLERTFPGGRLYGPYSHDGREYYQWMVRGTYLRDEILPLLERMIRPEVDAHTYARLQQMKERYSSRLGSPGPALGTEAASEPEPAIGYVASEDY
jgi:hypothetical protein